MSGDAGTYGYDYLGRRVWRTVTGSSSTTQTHYVFDQQGHLLAEHDGATGAVLREYVWLDDTPVAMIDSTGTSPATYFIHTGQIEEPLVMTDASQAKVWDAYVEPFGAATVFGTPSAGLDLRLPGQFNQAETGALSQNWNRDYDTSLGRYIEADPLGIEAGQNVYGYVDGDPLGSIDFSGLDLNLFPRNDALFDVGQLQSYADQYTVKGHGNASGLWDQNGQRIYASELANLIKKDPKYKRGHVVILASCNTGAGLYAQWIANYLGAPVVAPNQYVFFGKNGKPYVAAATYDAATGKYYQIPDTAGAGAWKRFYPQSMK